MAEFRGLGQKPTAITVLLDWKASVRYWPDRNEQRVNLRISKALESVFVGVRLRIDAGESPRRQNGALNMVFNMVQQLSGHWRALNGGANLMALVITRKESGDVGERQLAPTAV